MAAVLQDTTATKILTLDSVRGELIRLEETIIFGLIERSQFAVNKEIYATGKNSLLKTASTTSEHSESYLDFFLEKTEQLHASLGRYTSPDEHPFLIEGTFVPLIQAQSYPQSLKPNSININEKIKAIYETKIIPRICQNNGSDGQYGSSATMDINVLQSISKRIHFGKFVAEAKFLQEKEKYSKLIKNNDADGLMKLLTKQSVEDKVVERVTLKAGTYGLDPTTTDTPSYAIPPEEVGQLYREFVMPLNKDVQVSYLLQRLGGANVAYQQSTINSQQAAIAFAGSNDNESIVGCDDLTKCFALVKSNKIARCCACIETTPGAIVHTTHTLLFENAKDLHITRELIIDTSRFLEISKSKTSVSGQDKTALSIGLQDSPGALSQILNLFASNNVNLLLISSISSSHGRSGFYIEVDGHIKDDSILVTLDSVRKIADYCVVLGSFQKA
jgi:chorismate mutase